VFFSACQLRYEHEPEGLWLDEDDPLLVFGYVHGAAMLYGSGAVPMGTSQRVSRGFHRLGLLLAAIPLLLGGSLSVYIARSSLRSPSTASSAR
jgi:hypothetical protein